MPNGMSTMKPIIHKGSKKGVKKPRPFGNELGIPKPKEGPTNRKRSKENS